MIQKGIFADKDLEIPFMKLERRLLEK